MAVAPMAGDPRGSTPRTLSVPPASCGVMRELPAPRAMRRPRLQPQPCSGERERIQAASALEPFFDGFGGRLPLPFKAWSTHASGHFHVSTNPRTVSPTREASRDFE